MWRYKNTFIGFFMFTLCSSWTSSRPDLESKSSKLRQVLQKSLNNSPKYPLCPLMDTYLSCAQHTTNESHPNKRHPHNRKCNIKQSTRPITITWTIRYCRSNCNIFHSYVPDAVRTIQIDIASTTSSIAGRTLSSRHGKHKQHASSISHLGCSFSAQRTVCWCCWTGQAWWHPHEGIGPPGFYIGARFQVVPLCPTES